MTTHKLLNKIGQTIAILLIVSPAVLFFIWMISLSLKYEIDNGAYPPILIPEQFAWSNYTEIFATNDFLRCNKHSVRPELRRHQIGNVDIGRAANPSIV